MPSSHTERERQLEAALAAVVDMAVFAHDEYVKHDLKTFPGGTFRDHLLHRLSGTSHAYQLYDMTQAYRLIDFVDWLVALREDHDTRAAVNLSDIIDRAEKARDEKVVEAPQ